MAYIVPWPWNIMWLSWNWIETGCFKPWNSIETPGFKVQNSLIQDLKFLWNVSMKFLKLSRNNLETWRFNGISCPFRTMIQPNFCSASLRLWQRWTFRTVLLTGARLSFRTVWISTLASICGMSGLNSWRRCISLWCPMQSGNCLYLLLYSSQELMLTLWILKERWW